MERQILFAFFVVFLLVQEQCAVSFSEGEFSRYCSAPVSAQYPGVNDNLSLKQVIAVFRHGDRTKCQANHCWPGSQNEEWDCSLTAASVPDEHLKGGNIPLVSRLYRKQYDEGVEFFKGNCMIGQLTVKGYQQHIKNGENFRKIYHDGYHLVNAASDVYLRSTDVPRTLQSAQAIYTGMFPADARAQHTSLVALHTRDSVTDNLLSNHHLCPLVSEYMLEAKNSSSWKERQANVAIPLKERLFKTLKYPRLKDVPSWANLFDCIGVHTCNNRPLPAALTQDLIDQIADEAIAEYSYVTTYPDRFAAAKANLGTLINEFLVALQSAVRGEPQPPLRVYSGHDITIMPLALFFDLAQKKDWSPYASSLVFELFEMNNSSSSFSSSSSSQSSTADDTHFVRMLYNYEPASIPDCGGKILCPWTQFQTILKSLSVPAFTETNCGNSKMFPHLPSEMVISGTDL
eukprot:GCRY01001134.1.p1 GENE.GCRY01001134.1~~GCRY01001134.1.p1  ORF type:complete len:483 (-),score=82.13 GCRY01001134.1:200-1576(-)